MQVTTTPCDRLLERLYVFEPSRNFWITGRADDDGEEDRTVFSRGQRPLGAKMSDIRPRCPSTSYFRLFSKEKQDARFPLDSRLLPGAKSRRIASPKSSSPRSEWLKSGESTKWSPRLSLAGQEALDNMNALQRSLDKVNDEIALITAADLANPYVLGPEPYKVTY